MDPARQPLRFQPICTGTDGVLLSAFAGEGGLGLPEGTTTCWHLIDAGETQSIVAEGESAGTLLCDLVRDDPEGIVGRGSAADAPFPVCLRLLETTVDMPLSVFPQGRLSRDGMVFTRNQRFWYSIAADPDAWACAGIGMSATRLSIMSRVNSRSLQNMLRVFQSLPGDAFFIPGGCLHALSKGNLVWDIAEHAGVPLKMSGWENGDKVSPSEIERAAEAVVFQDRQLRRIPRESRALAHTRRVPLLNICPQFAVDQVHLRDRFSDRTNGTTFHALLIHAGRVRLESDRGCCELQTGQSLLIPAAMGDYRLYCEGGPATVIRVSLNR